MNHLDGYCGPETPKVISDTLKRYKGDTPGGYPLYRLVHSASVYERIGGAWSDWDENTPYADRGSISNVLDAQGNPTAAATPIRTVIEVRTVPTYSHFDEQGWVLERWFPAHMFGSPEFHYSNVVAGTSVPLLGPYPERGKYVMLTGPFPEPPSTSFLLDFINFHQQKAEAILSQEVGAYIKQRVYDAEAADEKRRKKTAEDNFLRIMDASKNILFGTSLAAGRLRNKAAEQMGIRSHMGN